MGIDLFKQRLDSGLFDLADGIEEFFTVPQSFARRCQRPGTVGGKFSVFRRKHLVPGKVIDVFYEVFGIAAEATGCGFARIADPGGSQDGRPGGKGGEEIPEYPYSNRNKGSHKAVRRNWMEFVKRLISPEDFDQKEK